jgi:hypothetical protein
MPLLSSAATPSTPTPTELGKLVVVDMRHAQRHPPTPPRTQATQTSSLVPDGSGSWLAVVKNSSNPVQHPLESPGRLQSISPGLNDTDGRSGAVQPTSAPSALIVPAVDSNIPDSWEDDV